MIIFVWDHNSLKIFQIPLGGLVEFCEKLIFNLGLYIFNQLISTCPSKGEITAEIKTTEDLSKLLSASTAADSAPKIRLSSASPSETSLMPHPKKISNKTELSKPTSSPNSTLRCSIVLDAEFTRELWKWDPTKIERTELLLKEFKEMPLVRSLMLTRND